MPNEIEVSINEEMKNVANALKKVTRAAFEGSTGLAGTIKGKKKTAQFSFKIKKSNEKRSLESIARRQILGEIFKSRAAEVEIVMKKALEAVIAGLVGQGDKNVKVFGRSLGRAKPQRDLLREPFAQFVKSKEGAGEIGLPDPEESLRNLQIALLAAITVDVVIRESGPQVKFGFDQRTLLRLTPHPDRFEGGSSAPFFSWLSLVTGPDFAGSGTPGFALVRVKDLRNSLRNAGTQKSSRQTSRKNLRRANIVEGLIRSSRTRGNAGELAGVMMSTRAARDGKSFAEAFGGKSGDYRPSSQFKGFWDKWWMNSKLDLSTWAKRIMRATVKELLGGK